MPRRSARPFTLTNKLLVLAATIVVLTALLVAATAASGVYAMAVSQSDVRQRAYREIITGDIENGLQTGARLVRLHAADPGLRESDSTLLAQALAILVTRNAQFVTGAAILDADGVSLVYWPTDDVEMTEPPVLSRTSLAGGSPIVWAPGDGETTGSLWAAARVRGTEGATRILYLRLSTAFVDDALSRVADVAGQSMAFVFDETGRHIAESGGALMPAGTIEFVAGEDGEREGRISITGERRYIGQYVLLESSAGPLWRVAVLGPAEQALRETWTALRSGILGWLVALVLAVAGSIGVIGGATRPLRQLEVRARALAEGAHVEQAAVDQRDEVGRLIESFNSIATRLDRLAAIAELLARASDTSLVLKGVTSSIAQMLGGVDVDVFLHGDGDSLELVAAEGVLDRQSAPAIAVSELPWVADAVRSGEPVLGLTASDDALAALHGYTESAVIAAPLQAGETIIGVIAIVRRGSRPFATADAEAVRSFAAQASLAIRNARLFEVERRSRQEAEALRAVAERVSSPLALDETLAEVARTSAGLLGASAWHFLLRDRKRFGLAVSDTDPGSADDSLWLDVWSSAAGASDGGGVPVLVSASDTGPTWPEGPAVDGASSALLVPLVLHETLEGLLVLLFPDSCPALGKERLDLAATLGKQASLALSNAYLYETARNRADNLETIFRISHAVGSSLQSRIVLNRVLDVVQKILSADAVMLLTYDVRRKVMTVPMARGVLHRDMLEATFRPGEDVPGRVFETREPERFDRLIGTDTRLLNAASAQGLKSLLAVPLLARGRSIGVLAAFSMTESAFSTDDLDLLRTFASQAALAIDTAAMFSREHHVASVLQESILPSRLPRIEGIESSSVYLPAAGDAEIGGDYFDLFDAPDGRAVISIGDVCGKGVEAATKTSMIKYAIRGMVAAGLGPADVLRELNAMLVEEGDPSDIVTLWIGYLDVTSGAISYADAGHPPALALDPSSGRISRLSTTGPLLGAVEETEWSQASHTLAPGATLLLYTDGVTEARSGVRFFGEGRVRRALRQGGSASEVADRLLHLVQRFASGELRDDAAILTIVRRSV